MFYSYCLTPGKGLVPLVDEIGRAPEGLIFKYIGHVFQSKLPTWVRYLDIYKLPGCGSILVRYPFPCAPGVNRWILNGLRTASNPRGYMESVWSGDAGGPPSLEVRFQDWESPASWLRGSGCPCYSSSGLFKNRAIFTVNGIYGMKSSNFRSACKLTTGR